MSALRTTAMRIPRTVAASSLARSAPVASSARSIVTLGSASSAAVAGRTAVAAPSVAAAAAAAAASATTTQPWRRLAVQQRGYAASAGLSQQEIQNRIFEVLKSFEKVDPAKVSASSSFTSDLGLDSLDAVEVVMAIEEEFSIEIPDAEADAITTVQQAIDYIGKTPSAH